MKNIAQVKFPIEKQFNVKNIELEQKYISRFMKQQFSDEFIILKDIVSLHLSLLGFLFQHGELKKGLGLRYDENIPLNNSLLNNVYLSLSGLDILKKGYYGSARVLFRQSFEMLMIGKCCEYNKELRAIWARGDMRMWDVWKFLKDRKIEELKELYKELCKYTHHTPFSQQPLRLPSNTGRNRVEEFEEERRGTNFKLEMRYTFDSFFVLLNMLFHLNNLFHKKVRNFDMGYYRDRFGHYNRIKEIKENFKKLRTKYFSLMKNRGVKSQSIKRWKNIIYQYRSIGIN